MKFTIISLLLLSLGWQGQTTEPAKEVSLDEEFTVKMGQPVIVKDANLKITFIAILEDSRCPIDVWCGQAGNARLNIEVKRSKKKFTFVSFNTTAQPRDMEILYKGYKVRFVKLEPQRKYGFPIEPEDYEATFIVSSK